MFTCTGSVSSASFGIRTASVSAGVVPRDGRDPVLRGQRLDRVGRDRLDHDAFGAVRVDLDGLGAGLVLEQRLERLDRGEAPLLLAPVGTGKSATSYDVVRSLRACNGTGDPGP